LVVLPLDAYQSGEYAINAIHRMASPPGPAGRWLIDRFRARLSACPAPDNVRKALSA
jgi:hypothetical protein